MLSFNLFFYIETGLVNDEDAPLRMGSGDCSHKYYCGRFFGTRQLPNSNGYCGPNNGPQCQSCQRFQVKKQKIRKLFFIFCRFWHREVSFYPILTLIQIFKYSHSHLYFHLDSIEARNIYCYARRWCRKYFKSVNK